MYGYCLRMHSSEQEPRPRDEQDYDYDHRDALPHGPAHKRGAGLNPGNRFENNRVHVLGDALEQQRLERQWEGEDGKPINIPLTVYRDKTKKLINRVTPTSDVPFEWTVNPYRGCEHG